MCSDRVLGFSITVSSDNKPFKLGAEGILRCQIYGLNGHTLEYLVWRKGSEYARPIAYYEDGMITLDSEHAESYTMTITDSLADQGSSNLTIKEVKVDDIGTYYCTGSAGFIIRRKSIDVNVIGKIESYIVLTITTDFGTKLISYLFFLNK